jgi:iron complex outermembrane receptor protein
MTGGLVYSPTSDFMITLDLYQIDVDDRIALLTQSITPGSPEDIALAGAGFPGIGSAGFFANAFDTRVRGIEIALTKRFDLGDMGDFTLDARHSWNEQDVQNLISPLVNPEMLFDFQNQLPAHRTVVTGTWDYGAFTTLVRMNYFDGWKDLTFGELGDFESEFVFDASFTARFMDRHSLTIGADNIFDEYPDDETNSVLRFLGATRTISSPFGFNGGFWYVRLNTRF